MSGKIQGFPHENNQIARCFACT